MEYSDLCKAAVPKLMKMLDQDPNMDACITAAWVLGQTNAMHAMRPLQEIVANPAKNVKLRQAANEAVEQLRANALAASGAAA